MSSHPYNILLSNKSGAHTLVALLAGKNKKTYIHSFKDLHSKEAFLRKKNTHNKIQNSETTWLVGGRVHPYGDPGEQSREGKRQILHALCQPFFKYSVMLK